MIKQDQNWAVEIKGLNLETKLWEGQVAMRTIEQFSKKIVWKLYNIDKLFFFYKKTQKLDFFHKKIRILLENKLVTNELKCSMLNASKIRFLTIEQESSKLIQKSKVGDEAMWSIKKRDFRADNFEGIAYSGTLNRTKNQKSKKGGF